MIPWPFARIIGAVVYVLLLCTLESSTASAQRPNDQLMLQTTTDVLQCVFAGNANTDTINKGDVLWIVRGRVIPHADAEWQYTIKQMRRDRGAEVELLTVQGGKLLGRSETTKAMTCAELLSFVRVGRRVVRTDQCSPLRHVVSRFPHLRLPNVPDSSVRVDVSLYTITAGTTEGDEFQWRVAGMPNDHTSANPLVPWSEDLRRAIESCP